MIRVALLGLGKMGLSHCAIINTHPDIELVAICDTAEYLLAVLGKYAHIKTYSNYRKLLAEEKLDAVFIATPSRFHADMVKAALDAGLHVFCEKPFCLDAEEGLRLAELAEDKGRVNQVGYHYRFVGTFHELKHLLDAGTLGTLHHIRAEAFGPVVLRPKGRTWRTNKSEGGGLSGQISANWSDESQRKMSTKVSVWGTNGKIVADRQEMQVYLRDRAPDGFNKGWNTRYTTDLTEPVWFYLRGEEYSAQVSHFVDAIKEGRTNTRSDFRSAVDTDLVLSAMVRDADRRTGATAMTPVMPDVQPAP